MTVFRTLPEIRAQNWEKNFQMVADSSDQIICPPLKRHQVVWTGHPWYWTQGEGDIAWVWVPHSFRFR